MIVSLLFAVSISLSSPSDYKITPFPYDASYLRGEVAGPGAQRSVPRLEEFAFLSEAFAERDMALGIKNKFSIDSKKYPSNFIHRCMSVLSNTVGTNYFGFSYRTPMSLSIDYCLNDPLTNRNVVGGVCIDDFSLDDGVYLTDSDFNINNKYWWDAIIENKPYRKTGEYKYLTYDEIFDGIRLNKSLAFPNEYFDGLYHNLSVATCGLKMNYGDPQRGSNTITHIERKVDCDRKVELYSYPYTDRWGQTSDRYAWCYTDAVLTNATTKTRTYTYDHSTDFLQSQRSLVREYYTSKIVKDGWSIPTVYQNVKLKKYEPVSESSMHQSPLANSKIVFYDDDLAKLHQEGTQLGTFRAWVVYLGFAKVREETNITGTGYNERVLLNTNFVSVCELPNSSIVRTDDYKGVEFSCNLWSHGVSQAWAALGLNSYVGSSIIAPDPPDFSYITDEEITSSDSEKILTATVNCSSVFLIIKVKPSVFRAQLLNYQAQD